MEKLRVVLVGYLKDLQLYKELRCWDQIIIVGQCDSVI